MSRKAPRTRLRRFRVSARFERKWADTWIGAYWSPDGHDDERPWRSGTVWICLVPCFPLKINWWEQVR